MCFSDNRALLDLAGCSCGLTVLQCISVIFTSIRITFTFVTSAMEDNFRRCLFVCLSVSNLAQKLLNGFACNFQERYNSYSIEEDAMGH